jgi:hypothetical protein
LGNPEVVWLPRGFEFLSGLPERKRRKRNIVALQAFIDDSGTKGTGKVLMLGGLMASAEALATVADTWDRELRAHIPLPIGYFKAYEAQQLDGEFSHWRVEGRDQKVRRLASVVDRDNLVLVMSTVHLGSHRLMESVIGQVEGTKKHPFNQPYLLALLSVMFTIAKEMWFQHRGEKVEVIFDEQLTFKADAKEQYRIVREEIAPEWFRQCMPVEPLFRDDRDFVVLQGADLLMGNARMVVEHTPRWPQIDWQKLKVSPFCQPHWLESLADLTRTEVARRLDVPPEAVNINVVPRDGE